MTSFDDLYKLFDSRIPSATVTEEQKNAFLENAIPDFVDYFREIDVDWYVGYIYEDLTPKEKKFLALKMLEEYCRLEKAKHSKIYGTISDSTKISGVADVKKALREDLEKVEQEINQFLSTLV